MKYNSKLFTLFLVSVACCCGKQPSADITPVTVPTAITVDPMEIPATAAGGSYEIAVSAPARPKLSGVPDWITFKDGVFNNYKITWTLDVAANDTYSARSATLTVTAKDVPDVTVTVTQEGKEPEKEPEPVENDAWALSESLGLGWNMGNHFDAFYNGTWAGDNFLMPDETCWGAAPATQKTFDGVKAAGFTSVRIPVTWLAKIGPAPEYKIDSKWLDRVYEVVQFAHKAGLYVIINTHHDENHHSIIENGVDIDTRWQDVKNAALNAELNASIKKEITAVWTQIATRFADCEDWLIMEGFNEINDGGWGWSAEFRADPTKQCGVLNEWNQTFVDAVRATGGNNAKRWLGVPTYCASPQFIQYFTMPTDPAGKTMVSVHYYDPSSYTIGAEQYSDWGHTGASGKKDPYSDESNVREVFGMLYNGYVAKNIPVYIGEFGCSMRAQSDSRAWAFFLYYLEYIVKAAKTYGMPCFLWDNGAKGTGQEQHGYIDHGTGGFIGNSKIPVDIMVKARFNEDASYTLQSVYDSAPKF